MTDRVKGCTVVFDKDYREDDIHEILNAIKMIKGVIKVEPSITTTVDYYAKEQCKNELRSRFYKFIKDELD